MTKEIGLFSGICSGANPESPLNKPVFITVAIDREGRRKVGCPYIKGVKQPDNQIIYLCEAGSPGLKKIEEEVRTSGPEETPWQKDVDEIKSRIPLCYHKYPI